MKLPENYTSEQFVAEWTPDYEKRSNEYIAKAMQERRSASRHWFADNHFAEALRAYSEALCAEQREMCQDLLDSAVATDDPAFIKDLYFNRKLSSAPSPEVVEPKK